MESLAHASEVSALIKQLEALKGSPPENDGIRQKLLGAAQSLVHALETPGDTTQRIAYAVKPL